MIQPLGGVPNYADVDQKVPIDPQYPSLIALNSELLLASNGVGDIELIRISVAESTGKVIATTRYEGDGTEGVSPVPCVLLAARLIQDSSTSAIIATVYSRVASVSTQFNIATLEMSVTDEPTVELKLLHMLRGPEVPVYCAITQDGMRCIMGSEASYETIKRADGDVEMMTESEEETLKEQAKAITEHKPPPYKWTQDGADITMQFVLPAGTPKSAVSCNIASQHLSLIVRAQDLDISYPFRKLWGTVHPDESTWTLESNTGLLSIFLTKQDEHTRWPHIFDADDGVLETLDPSRLAEITAHLEKWTSSKEESLNAPFVQARQHPVATDADEDIDERGQPIRFAVYDRTGNQVQEIRSSGSEWLCSSFDGTCDSLPSICVKANVDGLVYAFEETPEGVIETKHVATYDAFAFVQASKRDSRFVRHDPRNRFATIAESNRNAYIYYRHGDKRTTEKQTVVDITLGHDVDIIGVQLVLDRTLMILTETEVVTLQLDG